jgi:hypothetical protein
VPDVAVVAHSRESFGGGLPELRRVLAAEGVTDLRPGATHVRLGGCGPARACMNPRAMGSQGPCRLMPSTASAAALPP